MPNEMPPARTLRKLEIPSGGKAFRTKIDTHGSGLRIRSPRKFAGS
jgi:hypothetical protein